MVEDIISSSDENIKPKTKAATDRLNVEVKHCGEFQVEKKDENGKDNEFAQ